jgi:hypothetical protein
MKTKLSIYTLFHGKSLIMDGQDNGFDIQTVEAFIERYMALMVDI